MIKSTLKNQSYLKEEFIINQNFVDYQNVPVDSVHVVEDYQCHKDISEELSNRLNPMRLLSLNYDSLTISCLLIHIEQHNFLVPSKNNNHIDIHNHLTRKVIDDVDKVAQSILVDDRCHRNMKMINTIE